MPLSGRRAFELVIAEIEASPEAKLQDQKYSEQTMGNFYAVYAYDGATFSFSNDRSQLFHLQGNLLDQPRPPEIMIINHINSVDEGTLAEIVRKQIGRKEQQSPRAN